MEMILIYPVFIGIATATAQLAHSRGRSARWWFFISLLLPIVSLPVLFMLKKKEESTTGVYEKVVYQHGDKVLYKKEEEQVG